jgi:hypothetical protein
MGYGLTIRFPACAFGVSLDLVRRTHEIFHKGQKQAVREVDYSLGTGGSFSGVKRQEREADHSLSPSAEVKKMWIYTSTPLYVFMA